MQNLYVPVFTFAVSQVDLLKTRNYSRSRQYVISLTLIIGPSILCFFTAGFIGYRAVALILLLAVSLNAILFDIYPVMLSALLSALIWNFFFIPPLLTLHIGTAEDGLMFLMYFVIASINAVLTYKIREVERKERDEQDKEKAIKLYNTLLNSLSHELRTPISTIIGAIDTIQDKQIRLSDDNRDELYSEIETAGLRLNRQVEKLLSMSRIEAGVIAPKKDWCDVNELVFSAIKETLDEASDHRVVFQPNENLPLFRLDGVLLEQIIYNLLHNALQHTPKGSTISTKASTDWDHCIINVADDGKGFPLHEISLVFNKFYRLEQSSTGGTGLGLSIVKGFAEAMNGTVLLENNPKGGATFTVKVPCEQLSHSEADHEQS